MELDELLTRLEAQVYKVVEKREKEKALADRLNSMVELLEDKPEAEQPMEGVELAQDQAFAQPQAY